MNKEFVLYCALCRMRVAYAESMEKKYIEMRIDAGTDTWNDYVKYIYKQEKFWSNVGAYWSGKLSLTLDTGMITILNFKKNYLI